MPKKSDKPIGKLHVIPDRLPTPGKLFPRKTVAFTLHLDVPQEHSEVEEMHEVFSHLVEGIRSEEGLGAFWTFRLEKRPQEFRMDEEET